MGAADGDTTQEFILRQRRTVARIDGRNFDVEREATLLRSGSWLQQARATAPDATPPPPGAESAIPGLSAEGLERALAAARIIAVTEGLGEIELERVIRLAGLGGEHATALRAAFPDGARLCVYLIGRFYQPLVRHLSESAIDDAEGPLVDKLVKAADLWVQVARRDLPFFLLINDAWRRPLQDPLPAPIQQAIQAVGGRWFSMVTSLLAECQVRGEVREGSPEVLAHVTSAMFYGLMATISRPDRLMADGVYADDVVKGVLEMFRLGVRR
jgi:hypothetical protein